MPVYRSSLARASLLLSPWLLLSTLSAACGDSEEPSAATETTVASYCQRSAELTCANLAGCCGITSDACIGAYRAGCEQSSNNATSRGLSFDPDAARRCVDESQSAYAGCVVPSLENAGADVCASVFTPTLQSGESCTFDAACRGSEGLAGVCSSGVCAEVPLLTAGAVCGSGVAGTCSPGSYCEGTCRPRQGSGQSCSAGLECISTFCEEQSCGTPPISSICEALTDPK